METFSKIRIQLHIFIETIIHSNFGLKILEFDFSFAEEVCHYNDYQNNQI